MNNLTPELEKQIQSYISLGWSLIPIGSNKRPVIKWKKYQSIRAKEEEVLGWVKSGHALGVVTGEISDLSVVDDDRSKHGLKSIPEEKLKAVAIATTQNGGRHYFYKHNGERSFKNEKLHVDIRGEGGYVALPPFNNRKWIKAPSIYGEKLSLMPKGLNEKINPLSNQEFKPSLKLSDHMRVAEGGRDDALFKLACSLLSKYESSDWNTAIGLIKIANSTYNPPLEPHIVEQKIQSAMRYVLPNKQAEKPQHNSSRLTETGNAERFCQMFKDKVRFDHRKKRWLIYKKNRWVPDKDGLTKRLFMTSVRELGKKAFDIEDSSERKKTINWAVKSEMRSIITNSLEIAKNIKPIADPGDDWDREKMILGCRQGIIDLKTGVLRGGKPEDRVTMSVGVDYDPLAECPRWEKFIQEVFEDDRELISYVFKALGYSISGDTSEQAAFFCFGSGSNGKSVMFKTIDNILGDYAHNAPASLFQKSNYSNATNDLAATEGKRFLVSSETLSSSKIHEQRMKSMTGGDTQTARFLHQEFFSFEPTAKPWLFLNHKPQVEDDSHGFWRRVRLIPFNRKFSGGDADRDLQSKLDKEAPGILNWLIKGCLLWQKEGLSKIPEKIKSATQEYQIENDEISEFVFAECEECEGEEIKARLLYAHYKQWASAEGYEKTDILSSTAFGRKMGDKFRKVFKKQGTFYQNICLKM